MTRRMVWLREQYSGTFYRTWGNLPFDVSAGDYLADGVLRVVYPGYQDSSYFHDETGTSRVLIAACGLLQSRRGSCIFGTVFPLASARIQLANAVWRLSRRADDVCSIGLACAVQHSHSRCATQPRHGICIDGVVTVR